MAKLDQLIAASEIGRFLYCARALTYDWSYTHLRSQSLWSRFRRMYLHPWKIALFIGVFVGLALIYDPAPAFLATLVGLILFPIIFSVWQWSRGSSNAIVFRGVRGRRLRKPLVASAFGLVGMPDYILQIEDYNIPVLCRDNPAPEQPHDAHTTQVVAYCLLVAENSETRPPYGVVRYGDGRTFEVDFDEDAVEVLSQVMDEVESVRRLREAPRSHEDRRRCYACSHRQRCDQSLF